jgi:hypothetical protein
MRRGSSLCVAFLPIASRARKQFRSSRAHWPKAPSLRWRRAASNGGHAALEASQSARFFQAQASARWVLVCRQLSGPSTPSRRRLSWTMTVMGFGACSTAATISVCEPTTGSGCVLCNGRRPPFGAVAARWLTPTCDRIVDVTASREPWSKELVSFFSTTFENPSKLWGQRCYAESPAIASCAETVEGVAFQGMATRAWG